MLPTLFLIAAITTPADIDRLVADHLHAPIGTIGGAERPVDPRLRLAACDAPLALTTQPRGDSVVVQCPGGWRLFVRVRAAPAAPAAATAASAVRRGQEVTVRLSGPGFAVTQAGTALEDAAAGGWVRVRRGTDVVRGRVTADGAVDLSPSP